MKLKKEAHVVLMLLQMQMLASFFDSQPHLLIHLLDDIDFVGPVHLKWMFFVERYIIFLKGYVHQKARPKGSMEEGYLLQEKIHIFCDMLMGNPNEGNGSGNNMSNDNQGMY